MTTALRTFVDIDATPEQVWHVLTDLPAYPEWNPFITSAEGTVAPGRRLSMSIQPVNARPVTLRPTVLEVTPGRRLRWRGRLGIPGLFHTEHIFTITVQDGGGVRLWQEEWFRGLLAPLMTGSLNRHTLPAFNAMNAALKDRIEAPPTRT
jgi:hypothetical protein